MHNLLATLPLIDIEEIEEVTITELPGATLEELNTLRDLDLIDCLNWSENI